MDNNIIKIIRLIGSDEVDVVFVGNSPLSEVAKRVAERRAKDKKEGREAK